MNFFFHLRIFFSANPGFLCKQLGHCCLTNCCLFTVRLIHFFSFAQIHKFHSCEFYCSDAQTHTARFQYALGMTVVAKSDQTTGNHHYASYVLRSNDMVFAITAPYSTQMERSKSRPPHPGFNPSEAHEFVHV